MFLVYWEGWITSPFNTYHLEYGNSWLPIDTFSELISKVEMIILNKRFYGSMNDNDLLNVELAKRDMIV